MWMGRSAAPLCELRSFCKDTVSYNNQNSSWNDLPLWNHGERACCVREQVSFDESVRMCHVTIGVHRGMTHHFLGVKRIVAYMNR